VKVSNLSVGTRSIVSHNQNLDEAFNQIVYAAILVVGAFLVGQNELSLGALVASTLLVASSLNPISRLGTFIADWSHAKQALKGLDEFLSKTETENTADRPALIKLQKFTPHISMEKAQLLMGEDETLAVSIAELDIKAGEKVAIIGPTGSGKTSLLRLMTGLYKPSSGRCFVSDVDMQLQDPAVLRKQIGYLPQQPALFNSTLKDNLCAGIQTANDSDLLDICKLVGLDKLVSSHPRGLNLMISEGGQGLSGGQSKLVGLARVLSQKAPLLLLDEPTGALDPQSEGQLVTKLKAYFKPEQTVVLVTHKMNVLQLVSRVIVVDQGKITMDGPRDAVLAKITPQSAGIKQAAAPSTGPANSATNTNAQ
jgi:ATP-binding cassette subfamily C protein LapB